MRKRIKIGLALSACWLALIGKTEAGPPFVTDDPEVPPVGGWEINIPFTLTRTPGLTQMNAPLLDMNYGLPQLQIEFDIPMAVSSDDRKGTKAGLGDLLYGIKWRFFDEREDANSNRDLSADVRADRQLPGRTRRRPSELYIAVTSREKLG